MSIDASLCPRYVIFLDIDGVLLPVPRFTFGGGELSVDCVHRLRRLVDHLGGASNVSIILSSTWRTSPAMVERLNSFLQLHTGGAVPPVEGGTPNGTVLVSKVLYYAEDPSEQRLVRDRVDEVMRWLHTHILDHPEGIGGRWIAIDDMKLDVDSRMAGHFLHTATDVGITDENVDSAIELVKSFPSPAEAQVAAEHSLVDPALKEEEINILKTLNDQMRAKMGQLEESLSATSAEVASLASSKKALTHELAEKMRYIQDTRYRLAVYDCSRRCPTLAAAVELAARKTGEDRKQLEAQIRKLVQLFMERKEVEKKRRAEFKKAAKSSGDMSFKSSC